MKNELALFKIWQKLIHKIINRKKEKDISKIEEKTLKYLCKNENKKYINILKNLSLESKARKAAKAEKL